MSPPILPCSAGGLMQLVAKGQHARVAGLSLPKDPGHALLIRPLTAADEPQWRRLWTAYLAFYDTVLPEQVFATHFARLLGDDPRDFHGLVAQSGDRLVGLAHYVFHRHGWSIGDTCYLQDLFADPDVRGQGLGRKLIEAVYAAADRQGAASVYWMTQENNVTARQLYDRIGTVTPFVKYKRP